ncbi:DUF1631 domain-containing protein [Marichromatium bheemlicum]|uniref:DUF1631 domain-containing protein n=1 Tax=Marichromatium bheemlicum TaxID=365339 RepID=A0ABX1I5Q7_9GAMM|nr:DUF1631 domain-containing protein [Marichromatium bheemlicum]NKN32915.1 DUF1631 domain-containing protein [Marichromatium bheemlicum]
MADRPSSNVVPLAGRDLPSEAPATVDPATLLAGCRDRLAHGLATVFAQHLDSANDDFLGMADRATSLEQQQLYFAAMDFLSGHGQLLLQHFRGAYVTLFEHAIGRLRGQAPTAEQGAQEGLELTLVDTDDFERDLAIAKLSARATCNGSQQLTALDRRLATLLQLPRIGQDDNPLYPRAFFTAMLDALGTLDAGEPLALVLLQEFERQTSAELPGIYATINRFLAEAGVLPDIPLAGPQRALRSQPLDATDTQPLSGAPSPASARHGETASSDVFERLVEALQAVTGRQPPPPQPPPTSRSQTLDIAELIHALTGLQRGASTQLPGLGDTPIDPAHNDALRQIRATPMANGSHPVDALTIDIVSMLFDAIFKDPELSAGLRAELAKLQIPVLKVALIDKHFFSDRRHPARRLLDLIASAGLGRGEEDEPRLLEQVRRIVDAVIDGFDDDIDVFAHQLQALEHFLEEEEARAQSKASKVLDELERRDRREVAERCVATTLTEHAHPDAPALIGDFIAEHWRQVLITVFVDAGEDSDDWRETVRVMEDLLWSIEPKHTPEDRDHLLTLLPDLITRLRKGLERVDQETSWDSFFGQLIRLHMAALHRETADEENASPPPSSPPSTTAVAPPPPPSSTAITPPADDDTDDEADHHLRLARALEVGAWVEFQSLRGTRKTLRLSWVSEYRGVYLFTNRQGDNALTLATTSLANHLRKGSARLLSRDPLTERAVSQVLEQQPGEPTDD